MERCTGWIFDIDQPMPMSSLLRGRMAFIRRAEATRGLRFSDVWSYSIYRFFSEGKENPRRSGICLDAGWCYFFAPPCEAQFGETEWG